MSKKLLATTLVAVLLIGLSACSGNVSSYLKCIRNDAGLGGYLCGQAVRHILGPADELIRSEPIQNAEILLIDRASLDETSTVEGSIRTHANLVFSELEQAPSHIALSIDQQGFFETDLDAGEYIMCVSFEPPGSEMGSMYRCEQIEVKGTEPTRVKISFSPMAGLYLNILK